LNVDNVSPGVETARVVHKLKNQFLRKDLRNSRVTGERAEKSNFMMKPNKTNSVWDGRASLIKTPEPKLLQGGVIAKPAYERERKIRTKTLGPLRPQPEGRNRVTNKLGHFT